MALTILEVCLFVRPECATEQPARPRRRKRKKKKSMAEVLPISPLLVAATEAASGQIAGEQKDQAAVTLQKALRRRSFFVGAPPDGPAPPSPQEKQSQEPRQSAAASDISLELSEGLLAHARGVSMSAFHGLADEVLELLAKRLSVIRFAAEESIMVAGVPGTWFGIVLSGQLVEKLPDGEMMTKPEGAILGEMAIWNRGGPRATSIVAADQPGIIAVMLVDDLRALTIDNPISGMRRIEARLHDAGSFRCCSWRQRNPRT